jgi:triacylglycerol lipase
MSLDVLNNAQPDVFGREVAQVLALAASRAYYRKSLAKRSATANDAQVVRVKCDSHSADIVTRGDTAIVAFRGTDDIRDWLANLNVDRVNWFGGNVHRGFHLAEESLAGRLLEGLPEHATKLWITGHSLGGALATLFAFRMQRAGHNVSGLYTFGSPRVGCRCFAAQHDWLLREKHFRVVHNSDAVPRVPLPLRFRHCGRLILINRHADVIEEPGTLYQSYDRLLGYRADLVRDHLMGEYLGGLAA